MWDNLGCVNFVGGEVGHLVAFCKTSLENENEKFIRKKKDFIKDSYLFEGINPAVAAATLLHYLS